MKDGEVDALDLVGSDDLCSPDDSEDQLTACIYCGVPADSIDHIPPRHMRDQLLGVGLVAMHEREVSSCRECNSALGARPLITITERRDYIKEYLRRRYKSVLRIKDWREDDLALFGDDLRKMILRGIALKQLTRERIAWTTRTGYVKSAEWNSVRKENGRSSAPPTAVGQVGVGATQELIGQQCRYCGTMFTSTHKFRLYCNGCISIHSMQYIGDWKR